MNAENGRTRTAESASADSAGQVTLRDPESTGGPRLVVDSQATEPTLAVENGEFMLRLPAAMARVLSDSLPGFAPALRAVFDTALVRFVDHSIDNPRSEAGAPRPDRVLESALSVVVGDFDGDSRLDVAMEGATPDSSAAFILLARSPASQTPALIYLARPVGGMPGVRAVYLRLVRKGRILGFGDGETPDTLNLLTEAIERCYFEKAAEVYYLERGVVRVFTTSD